jgi:hypothetical protein
VEQAVEVKIEEQAEFVEWWEEAVSVRMRPERRRTLTYVLLCLLSKPNIIPGSQEQQEDVALKIQARAIWRRRAVAR